jgi:hypothetical protein
MPCPVYEVVDFVLWAGSCGYRSSLDGRQFLVFFSALGMDTMLAHATARRMFYDVGASASLSDDVFLTTGATVEQTVFSYWAERRRACGELSMGFGTYATRQTAWNKALASHTPGASPRESLPLYASGPQVLAFLEFFKYSRGAAVDKTEALAYELFLSHGFDQSALAPGAVMVRRSRLVHYMKENTTIMKAMSSAWPVPLQRDGLAHLINAAETTALSGQQTVHFFIQSGALEPSPSPIMSGAV